MAQYLYSTHYFPPYGYRRVANYPWYFYPPNVPRNPNPKYTENISTYGRGKYPTEFVQGSIVYPLLADGVSYQDMKGMKDMKGMEKDGGNKGNLQKVFTDHVKVFDQWPYMDVSGYAIPSRNVRHKEQPDAPPYPYY